MRNIKVITNESFEKYIYFLARKAKFESRNRRFNEDRWDSLDLDDITTDVKAPSDSEVKDAVRELDLFDDVAIKTGAGDVDVAGDGKLRLLDLDPEGNTNKKSNEPDRDRRTAGLDFDDSPKKKDEPKPLPLGRRARQDARLRELAKQQADARSKEEPVRVLDFDDAVPEAPKKKSNVGAIGALDYDDDIDTSKVAASIEDVYTCLASSDVKIVKAMVKRYAGDITDENKIKEVMLVHATNLNLECLRVVCGDMKVVLTAKEKELGFIDRAEIKNALERFKLIASKLTGANNTYGLIPNAIVACTPDKQTKCVNVVDFLRVWCDLPLIPLYFRGSMIRHNYDLARYILNEIDNKLPLDILTGAKGLLNRMKQLDDIPSALMSEIAGAIAANRQVSSTILGDLIISLINNKDTKTVKTIMSTVTDSKAEMIRDYVEDNDAAAWQKLEKIKITKSTGRSRKTA